MKLKNENNWENVISDEEIKNFLKYRIENNKYRGIHLSQHNRWNIIKFKGLINSLINFFDSSKKEFLIIPNGDELNNKNISNKSVFLINDYLDYKSFVNDVNKNIKCGTPNSIKKNFFPDLENMKIIYRQKENDYTKVYLTENFKSDIHFFKNKDENGIMNIFKNYSLNLYNTIINPILRVLNEVKIIKIEEFLLFFTWYGIKNENGITIDEYSISNLINKWKKISRNQKNTIIYLIKEQMKKTMENQNKKNKRDWNNWKNETEQIISHLSNINILYVDRSNYSIHFNKLDENGNKIKFRRLQSPINEYMKNNNIKEKVKGFEFDHIIPFNRHTSYEEWILIDNWKNLIYIDGKSHNIKTQYGSKHELFYVDENNTNIYYLVVNQILNIKKIILKKDENIIFDRKNYQIFFEYNNYLLETLQ